MVETLETPTHAVLISYNRNPGERNTPMETRRFVITEDTQYQYLHDQVYR